MDSNKKTAWFKVTENVNGKTVYLDFAKGKNLIFWFIVIILGSITAVALFSPDFRVNGEVVEAGFLKRLTWMIYPWFVFMAIYYFVYFPLSITIIKRPDGSFEISKRDWFFRQSRYILNGSQNPRIIARRRRMIGMTLYVPIVYQPIIRYQDNGIDHDINLVFSGSYLMKGIGPRGVFKKEEMEEISRQINLPLLFEN